MKKFLLSSTAYFAPPDPPNGGGGDAVDDDERIEFTDDDDEGVGDPQGEPGEEDDPQDEPSDDQPIAAGGEQPESRGTRGDRQFGELRRQARERAEENARLTRQLAEMQQQIATLRQPIQPTETAQQRADRLALLSPEERAMEMVNETLERHNRNQAALNSQLLDQADRSEFQVRCAANPLFKKLEGDVERRRSDMVQREGNAPPRWVIATYLVGERVLAQQGKSRPAAQQRRQRQEARPVRAGGDVGGSRQRARAPTGTAEDFESRFGDVPI